MNTPPNGGPAFPQAHVAHQTGMSLRAYIATAALQGIFANAESSTISNENAAQLAVSAADALIAELNKETK